MKIQTALKLTCKIDIWIFEIFNLEVWLSLFYIFLYSIISLMLLMVNQKSSYLKKMHFEGLFLYWICMYFILHSFDFSSHYRIWIFKWKSTRFSLSEWVVWWNLMCNKKKLQHHFYKFFSNFYIYIDYRETW